MADEFWVVMPESTSAVCGQPQSVLICVDASDLAQTLTPSRILLAIFHSTVF